MEIEQDEAEVTPLDYQPSGCLDNERIPGEFEYLENFYKRYNKVLCDEIALQKEKERLGGENEDLQKILRQYLDGVSVNEQVLSSANPLMVVNNNFRYQGKKTVPVGGMEETLRPPAVIEAAHVIQNSNVQTRHH